MDEKEKRKDREICERATGVHVQSPWGVDDGVYLNILHFLADRQTTDRQRRERARELERASEKERDREM